MKWYELAPGWEPMDSPQARALLDRQTTIEDKHHLNGLLLPGGRVTDASHRKQRELSTGPFYHELLAINASLTQDFTREDHLRVIKNACYPPLFHVKRIDGDLHAHVPYRELLGIKGVPDDDIVYEFLVLSQWLGWNQHIRDEKWPAYLRWEVERMLPSHYPQGWTARQYEVTFMRGLIDDLNVAAQDSSIERPYKRDVSEPTDEDNLDCKKVLARVELDMRDFLVFLRSNRSLSECPRRTPDSLYFDGWFFHEHRLLKHLRAVRQLAVDGTPLVPQQDGRRGGGRDSRRDAGRNDQRNDRRGDRRGNGRTDQRGDQRSGRRDDIGKDRKGDQRADRHSDRRGDQRDRRERRDNHERRDVKNTPGREEKLVIEKKDSALVWAMNSDGPSAPTGKATPSSKDTASSKDNSSSKDTASSNDQLASTAEDAPSAPASMPLSDFDELREIFARDAEYGGRSVETPSPDSQSTGASAPKWNTSPSSSTAAGQPPFLIHPVRFGNKPRPLAPAPRNRDEDSDSE